MKKRTFILHPHLITHALRGKFVIFFGAGNLGMVGGIGKFVGDFFVNVIFLDDEKDFDWAAFGGGLCEFGLG